MLWEFRFAKSAQHSDKHLEILFEDDARVTTSKELRLVSLHFYVFDITLAHPKICKNVEAC